MSGTLANVQVAWGQPKLSVFNAGTVSISANTGLVIDSSNIMASDDLTQAMFAVAGATASTGLLVFAVSAETIPAGKVGRAWGPGEIAECVAQGTVTQGTYVGSSGTTAGSLSTASAVAAYAGLALATCKTTEKFPCLLMPGTSV